MGSTYNGLIDKESTIKDTLKTEENNYLNTLSNGLELINKLTKSKNQLSGENIFQLYDTYGFPSEIVEEIAAEKNIKLDLEGFKKLMQNQKLQSRKNSNFEIEDTSFINKKTTSSFMGYDKSILSSKVIEIYADNQSINSFKSLNTSFMLVTKETPFYPEGGGQISDTGRIFNDYVKIKVLNTQRVNNLILHHVILENGQIKVNDNIELEIDVNRRKKITINHSSTHLLHNALRHVLGEHVEQKGSLVTDQSLRFDFSHNKALTNDEISSIEKIISNEIELDILSKQKVTSYKKAIDSGALAFFDEKYDDDVRVINIGSKSIELCGGTHVTNTSTIRLFKIISESSVSTGVRRVEAVTGEEAYKLYQSLFSDIKDLSKTLNANPSDLKTKIDLIKNSEEKNSSLINNLNKKVANLYYYKLIPTEDKASDTLFFFEDCSDLSADQIKLLGDSIKSKNNNSISVLVKEDSNTINCYVSVSKKCKHRYNAKQIISELVSKFSAKGGGSPTFGTSVITDQKATVLMKYIEEFLKT